MTNDEVRALFAHMEWADAQVWTAIGTIDPAGDASLQERLHHVHVVQRIYLQLWQDLPHEVRELSTFTTLDDVRAWARDYYVELRRFLSRVDTAGLERPIVFPWADDLVKWFGEARTATLQETMQQVAMHTAHHRGQLTTTIRQLGGTPPLVDFIAWVWMGKPEPEWPSSEPGGR